MRHWEALTGQAAGTRPLEFEPAVPLETGAGASVKHLVEFLVQELSSGRTTLTTPFLVQAETALMHTLLGELPHSLSARLHARLPEVSPRAVRRAKEYIEAHLGEAISVEHIADACGLCVRSLQAAFRQHTGQTPMAFLRELRLQAVHRQLLQAAPGTTVTAVALQYGFAHLGRFAQDYARRFGEAPHLTLSRH